MNVRENLKAYLDGELSPRETREIESALAQDPELQRELDQLRAIGGLIARSSYSVEPRGLVETVERLSRGSHVNPLVFARMSPATIALASIVFISVAALFFNANRSVPYREEAPMPMAKRKTEGMPKNGFRSWAGALEGPSEVDAGEPAETAERIVRSADLVVLVRNPDEAARAVRLYLDRQGGYLESSESIGTLDGGHVRLNVRVPVANFDRTLEHFRRLGKVDTESISGQVVTSQLIDIGARLKVMRAEESAYLKMLEKANRIPDALSVRERLSRVRQEIESMAAQQSRLEKESADSIIRLTLGRPPTQIVAAAPIDPIAQAWTSAWAVLGLSAKTLVQGLIYSLVLAPLWIPVAVAVHWFRRHRIPA